MKLFSIFRAGLCPNCSEKLNYHSKKREIKRLRKTEEKKKTKQKHRDTNMKNDNELTSTEEADNEKDGIGSGLSEENSENRNRMESEASTSVAAIGNQVIEQQCWTKSTHEEEKSREQEFDEYLADLLL